MNKKIISFFMFLCFVSSAWSSAPEKPKQKIYLFLTEPLQDEESIVIHLNEESEQNIHLNSNDPNALQGMEDLYKIVYQKKIHGNKNEILIDLIQGGRVVLDVYDFYGKKLGNLFNGYQPAGLMVLDENENWKVFKRFKGIVYFTLTVDGRMVTKKLVAKVD